MRNPIIQLTDSTSDYATDLIYTIINEGVSTGNDILLARNSYIDNPHTIYEGSLLFSPFVFKVLQLFTYKFKSNVCKKILECSVGPPIKEVNISISNYINLWLSNIELHTVDPKFYGLLHPYEDQLKVYCHSLIDDFNFYYSGLIKHYIDNTVNVDLLFSIKLPCSPISYWKLYSKYKKLEKEFEKHYRT